VPAIILTNDRYIEIDARDNQQSRFEMLDKEFANALKNKQAMNVMSGGERVLINPYQVSYITYSPISGAY
jgi:hypothetical protein